MSIREQRGVRHQALRKTRGDGVGGQNCMNGFMCVVGVVRGGS